MATRTWKKSERSTFLVAPLEIKGRDEKARTFEGALSTSHLDLGNGLYRDIVHPGAFKRWAKTVKADETGAYVPLLDSHDRWSIMNVYGHALAAEERETGKVLEYPLANGGSLKVPEMFLDVQWQVIDGPDGERVFDRLRPGSVRKMSMGYDPQKADFVQMADGVQVRNLREVKVEEGSLVVFAMQPNAEVDPATVKAIAGLIGQQSLNLPAELRDQLAALHPDLAALLEEPAKGGAQAPDVAWSPEDPKRLALEALYRDLTIRSLGRGR